MKHVIIVGAGFAGLRAAKSLGRARDIRITVIDKTNHHLFQPLLYQVATGGLSQSDIAVPIRSILCRYRNISVLCGTVTNVDFKNKIAITDFRDLPYDYLIMACGVQHSYFNNESWETCAPGLKTLPQAMEIRRRILLAFEEAEKQTDERLRRKALTFVVVGGGPTGVELAGAIGEMSRFTLIRDFRNIDPKLTRIMLIEAGPRILSSFSEKQSSRATRDLEKLGVQVWTASKVTQITPNGIEAGKEKIEANTVLWAAGITAPPVNQNLEIPKDGQGRIIVEKDMSLRAYPNVFVCGDQASFSHQTGSPLPCLSPVAIQQGHCIAANIIREIAGKKRQPFHYRDKGQLATIGKSRAIADMGILRFEGFFAWLVWLFVHIYFTTGFNNRFFIFCRWVSSYMTNRKGARIILNNWWKFFDEK